MGRGRERLPCRGRAWERDRERGTPSGEGERACTGLVRVRDVGEEGGPVGPRPVVVHYRPVCVRACVCVCVRERERERE